MNKMNKMTLEHAIEVFKNGSELESRTDRIIERDAARQVALKSMIAWDKVINEIKEMIEFNSEGDYISEAGCGMEDCLGVIKKYIEEVER